MESFGFILEPTTAPKLVQTRVCFLTNFGFRFGPLFRAILGSVLAQDQPDAPRWAQEGHQEFQSSKKATCVSYRFPKWFRAKTLPMTASQGSRWRPRGILGSPKSVNKNQPKNGMIFISCYTNFGASLGRILGPELAREGCQKMGSVLEAILEPSWTCLGRPFEGQVRQGKQQCSGPGPGRGI